MCMYQQVTGAWSNNFLNLFINLLFRVNTAGRSINKLHCAQRVRAWAPMLIMNVDASALCKMLCIPSLQFMVLILKQGRA